MSDANSPGSRLKQAREAQGKSLSDMAKITRIALQQLEGIERDNYDRIAAPIYIKGFIKNYASALGLDPVPLLEDVERTLSSGGSSEDLPVRKSPSVPSPVADEEAEFDVVREPLKPRIQGPSRSLTEKLRDALAPLKKTFSAFPMPADRRVMLIGATLLGVLFLVLVLRGCAGAVAGEGVSNDDAIPIEDLEQLLIATPEPILFELPQSTP